MESEVVKMHVSLGSGRWALLMTAVALTGCGVETGASEGLDTAHEPLYLTGTRWPVNGSGRAEVPVCFNAASAARSDYATVRQNIRRAVNVSWAAVANIVFSNMVSCPTNTNGMVVVNVLNAPADGSAKGDAFKMGYQGANTNANLNITANAPQGLIIHEFGHLLGFAHEMARPDFTDDTFAGATCKEPNVTGGDVLGTPADDRNSIMAGWPYCGNTPANLTAWDIHGVQVAYGPNPSLAGFVWNHDYTGSYDAAPGYSYNSVGGTNRVTSTGTGTYRVDFEGLGGVVGGNVQVTAYGGSNAYCNVANWSSALTTLEVNVACFDGSGNPKDSKFSVSYAYRSGAPGSQGGYVWANDSTSASYTPAGQYQWSSTGGTNTVTRNNVGDYSVFFPGQSFLGGTAEVTAYNSNRHCKVQSFATEGDGQRVYVRCYKSNGEARDSQFTLAFSNVSPNNTPAFAYAWADNSTAASYTPNISYQKGFVGGAWSGALPPAKPVTVTRSATGQYHVDFPGLNVNGAKTNVKVTAFGSSAGRCKVNGWGNSDANVLCFGAAGEPADARFAITFSSDAFLIP